MFRPMDLRTRAIIARLLGNLGSRSEVEQYLRHYGSAEVSKCAVIHVSGRVLQTSITEMASSLAFLSEVGLKPIVVHGARPQLEAVVEDRIIERETDSQWMAAPGVVDAARRVFVRANNQILEAIEKLGVRARSLPGGIFRVSAALPGQGAFPVEVEEEPIRWALEAGAIPVVSALAEDGAGRVLSLDSVSAISAIAKRIEPHKLIFLDADGLSRQTGEVISAVNLAEDFEMLRSTKIVNDEVLGVLTGLYQLLEELPRESSVSFTSPAQLPRELFTHTGAGTLVRRGVHVHTFDRFDEVDVHRLDALLEACFGRPLVPGYFEERKAQRIYLSDDYRAVAIIADVGGGVPYLDKFAVTAAAQGEGLGASVWRRLQKDLPRLFWRARKDNPVNPWYFRKAQGTFSGGDWVVFWYGLDDFASAKDCVEIALSLPPTLVPG